MTEEVRPDLKLAMADILEEISSLSRANGGMAAATRVGEFLLSLDRAERSAQALAERYAALRKALFNEPIRRSES